MHESQDRDGIEDSSISSPSTRPSHLRRSRAEIDKWPKRACHWSHVSFWVFAILTLLAPGSSARPQSLYNLGFSIKSPIVKSTPSIPFLLIQHFPSPCTDHKPAASKQGVEIRQFSASGMCRTLCN